MPPGLSSCILPSLSPLAFSHSLTDGLSTLFLPHCFYPCSMKNVTNQRKEDKASANIVLIVSCFCLNCDTALYVQPGYRHINLSLAVSLDDSVWSAAHRAASRPDKLTVKVLEHRVRCLDLQPSRPPSDPESARVCFRSGGASHRDEGEAAALSPGLRRAGQTSSEGGRGAFIFSAASPG